MLAGCRPRHVWTNDLKIENRKNHQQSIEQMFDKRYDFPLVFEIDNIDIILLLTFQ